MKKTTLLKMKKMLLAGSTLKEVGEAFGYTREYIRLLMKKHFPELTRKDYGLSLRVEIRNKQKQEERLKTKGRLTHRHETEFSRRCSAIFISKRRNAKSTKWGWKLEITDVHFPTHCPILGMKLDYSGNLRKENSPSFDRINPKKGYVKGNVLICSWRANRIKNDGTAAEHEKIANFLRLQKSGNVL